MQLWAKKNPSSQNFAPPPFPSGIYHHHHHLLSDINSIGAMGLCGIVLDCDDFRLERGKGGTWWLGLAAGARGGRLVVVVGVRRLKELTQASKKNENGEGVILCGIVYEK